MDKKGFTLRLIATVLICICLVAAGAFVGTQIDKATSDTFAIVTLIAMGVCLLIIAFNAIFIRIYRKSKEMSVRQLNDFLLTRHEEATKSLYKAVRKIARLRIAVDIYSAFIILIGMFIAFSMGICGMRSSFTLFPAYLIFGYLNRIHFGEAKYDFSEYLDPNEYPRIHALAYKAAKTVGVKGEIRIILLADCNAGIAKIDDKYSLQIGVQLLMILSEEELYQVLIHEFAHLTKEGNPHKRETKLFEYITTQNNGGYIKFFNMMFSFIDCMYAYEFFIYKISSSVAIEKIADNAVLVHGDGQTASSALAKLAYYELFNRELCLHVSEHYYEPSEPRHDTASVLHNAFIKALSEREEFWHGLIMKEIQPRSASHPITRTRIEALNVSDFTVTLPTEEGEYYEECKKALLYADNKIYEGIKESYAAEREKNYLAPLRTVNEWRESGKELSPEEARPVMKALSELSLNEELNALCDSILERYDNKFETAHASMIKGSLLLLYYDKRGIDYIYASMEANPNYIDEGIELIGSFLCTNGLENELNIFRERGVEFQQAQKDEYSKVTGLSPKDDLIKDDMPKEMLESIIAFILGVADGCVDQIYLVRKVITDTFFASAFVIRFGEEVKEDVADKILDKIFYHLDTRPEDWQFSLYYYDKDTAAAVSKVADSCVYDVYTKNKQ